MDDQLKIDQMKLWKEKKESNMERFVSSEVSHVCSCFNKLGESAPTR